MSSRESKATHIGEEGWCTVIITATPSAAATWRSAPSVAIAREESRPVKGSSMNRRRGRARSSVAMFKRFCSPPDSPRSTPVPTTVRRAFSRRRRRTIRCISWSFASEDQLAGNRSSAVHRRCSSTDSFAKKMSFCIEYPAERFQSGGSGRPLSRTSPAHRPFGPNAGRSASRFRSVVLPAPDGPITARSSPGFASPEAPYSTCLCSFFSSSYTNASTSRHDRCILGSVGLVAPCSTSCAVECSKGVPWPLLMAVVVVREGHIY
mmetsp:Transcript_46242/g.121233  ORF Transcript_46242/g.121233 Transcript_46242/m.121233 type:complete len:264 (-) Transcript_46242:50-841(-)